MEQHVGTPKRGNKHDEPGCAAQVVACLVNLNLVRFTSYPNEDANVLGRHWLTTIFEQVCKLQVMAVGSCPVDFSGRKRDKTSQYQLLLSVIDELGCLQGSGNPDIETLSDRVGNNNAPTRHATASRQQPLNKL